MIRNLTILFSIIAASLLFSQEYCAGDQVSNSHQNQIFDVCYGECDCEGWSLSDYAGDIIFLDLSASWCSPCFSAIDLIDELEAYWSSQNVNVKFVTALADIGGGNYSCEQWGYEGIPNSPLIIEEDGSLFNWFKDSNGQYPSYVILDHTMTVRAKPSNLFSNSNNSSCDGGGMDGDCINSIITSLLDECGQGCSSGQGCSDAGACNDGDAADCIYAPQYYDCCGQCIAEVDCLGDCGGSAEGDECGENTGECPTCTIVCHPDSSGCIGDFTNIQDAINSTTVQDGDTILVEQGTYYENLILQKSINLTSRAIFDDLDGWIGYEDEYVVLNNNINHTILDGSMDTNGDGLESVLFIQSPDECIEPLIFGFTIQGGSGSIVLVEEEGRDGEREQVEKNRGGGFLSLNALPNFQYNAIINNEGDEGEDDIEGGAGGGKETTGISVPTHPDYDWGNPRSECTGELDLSYNFWSGNDADYGNTFRTTNFEGSVDMSNSIFDVYNCPEEEVSIVWVDVDEEVNVNFDNGVGDLCSITEDVWVSPEGNNNNLGTSASEAFLTIGRALEMIAPEDNYPIIINLTEGTFSPSTTGEEFPIIMISNVNLIGQGEEITIINADSTERVITMKNCQNNIISNLTITGGSDPADWYGGGIRLVNSNPIITHVTINGNFAYYGGGGMYLSYSNPLLSYVTISDNTANNWGGGMYLEYSNPTLTHVIISENNEASGISLHYSNPLLTNVTINGNYEGGMNLYQSDPTLTNVKIYGNDEGHGVSLYYSNPLLTNVTISGNDKKGLYLGSGNGCSYPTLKNSIIWNNQESISGCGSPTITYSDIEGGWQGDGNINADPQFTDPANEDYTLQPSSPCIDTGDSNIWYSDIDGSRADMGATGGLYTLPNLTNHDFGDVGDIVCEKQFNLYNYRETPINITDIQFTTSSFTTEITSLAIEPLETGIINIEVNNTSGGYVEDTMELISADLPDGISVSLSVMGTEGNVLTGNLSGSYPAETYHISGDLTIAEGDTAYLHAGTEFLFDGEVNFNVYGTLKAIGTETDSIIFDNYGEEKWRGFTLQNVSNQTEFEYVRISGAKKDNGGGMYLYNSNPTLTNILISGNTAYLLNTGYPACWEGGCGGGMYLELNSNPTLTHVNIVNNMSEDHAGGMYLKESNPTLTHVTLSDNTTNKWSGGMHVTSSNPTLTNVTIINNTADRSGGGMHLHDSNPILTNVTISNNTAALSGGGMHINDSNPTLTNVTITNNTAVADNGGGMYLGDSNPILTHLTITNNTAGSIGGGMYLYYYSNPTLTNVTITNNTAGNDGGGMYLYYYSNPTLINTTIANNTADAYGGGIYIEESSPIFTNVIIWENSPESIHLSEIPNCNNYNDEMECMYSDCQWDGENQVCNIPEWYVYSVPLITYSDIAGSWEGEGNIDADPLFCDAENGDLTVQSDSPVLGAGQDGTDMGAYGVGCEGEDECNLGDVNCDGTLNILDVVLVANMVLADEYDEVADVNGDGALNVLDIITLVNWVLYP